MNAVLARRVVKLALSQMARVLNAPAIRRLNVQVQVSDTAETAATAAMGAAEQDAVRIVLPCSFEGVCIEDDNDLYLGLTAHEIGHLPDLHDVLALLAQAQQSGGRTLVTLFNLVEDMRIESGLRDTVVNRWLTRARAAVHTRLPAQPEGFWDLLFWLRFGNPPEPLNPGLPSSLTDAYDVLCEVVYEQADAQGVAVNAVQSVERERLTLLEGLLDFWRKALRVLREQLPQGPEGAYRAAQRLLELADGCGLSLPAEPPELAFPSLAAPEDVGEAFSHGVFAAEGLPGEGTDDLCWDQPDADVLAEGQRLARRLVRWWTVAPTRHIAAGVGKYNPRLEGRGIPPFTLPLLKQHAPPPRLALFLDVSGSMWEDDPAPLRIARVTAIAITTAVRDAGGQAKVWAFHGGVTATYLGDDPRRIAAARGGSTCLNFLAEVLRYLPGRAWHYLFITDAQIDAVPAAWDAAHQARTSVIYIPEGGRDYHTAAARLGARVLTVRAIDDLAHLTALVTRRYFGSAARG